MTQELGSEIESEIKKAKFWGRSGSEIELVISKTVSRDKVKVKLNKNVEQWK
jgi:hypothetical protein